MFIYKIPNKYWRYKRKNHATVRAFCSCLSFKGITATSGCLGKTWKGNRGSKAEHQQIIALRTKNPTTKAGADCSNAD